MVTWGASSYAVLSFPTLQVFSQYREHGVLVWRGFSFDDFANQVRPALPYSVLVGEQPALVGAVSLSSSSCTALPTTHAQPAAGQCRCFCCVGPTAICSSGGSTV